MDVAVEPRAVGAVPRERDRAHTTPRGRRPRPRGRGWSPPTPPGPAIRKPGSARIGRRAVVSWGEVSPRYGQCRLHVRAADRRPARGRRAGPGSSRMASTRSGRGTGVRRTAVALGAGPGPWPPRPHGSWAALVLRCSSRCWVACAISSTASSNAAWLAADGLVDAGDLADVLEGGGPDLVGRRRRLEVVELADVAAHASSSRRPPGGRVRDNVVRAAFPSSTGGGRTIRARRPARTRPTPRRTMHRPSPGCPQEWLGVTTWRTNDRLPRRTPAVPRLSPRLQRLPTVHR